jgi:hypothetical protein
MRDFTAPIFEGTSSILVLLDIINFVRKEFKNRRSRMRGIGGGGEM